MPTIRELLARRTDLSTFVVHLTREYAAQSPSTNLGAILGSQQIEARNAFGSAISAITEVSDIASQKCVCFTETPLEHLHLFFERITDLVRNCDFAPYGLAITKRVARESAVNPVWYTDISPTGHNWLMNSVNELVAEALAQVAAERQEDAGASFRQKSIARLTPFIEQMGHRGGSYRKEFWWEREWRHVGDFLLPRRYIVIAPQSEHAAFLAIANVGGITRASAIDANWGLEEIIGRLAGFSDDQVGVPV
jgi:hypothetical protein